MLFFLALDCTSKGYHLVSPFPDPTNLLCGNMSGGSTGRALHWGGTDVGKKIQAVNLSLGHGLTVPKQEQQQVPFHDHQAKARKQPRSKIKTGNPSNDSRQHRTAKISFSCITAQERAPTLGPAPKKYPGPMVIGVQVEVPCESGQSN